jgi:hypothetical protein
VESQPLYFLRLHVCRRIVEIKDNVALVNLLHEKLLPAIRRDFVEAWKFLQFPLALIGNIKSRRMLTLRSPNTFRQIFRCGLKAIEDMGFPRRGQVARHGLSGTGWGNVLQQGVKVSEDS